MSWPTQRCAGVLQLLAILLVVWSGGPVARALTVATYNVENYTVADRMVEGVFRPAYPKPEAEKDAVRQAIRAIAPDVLAMQEMGKPPFLEELQRDLRREGLDLPHGVVLEAADADRHVALLSRVPPKEIRRHTAVPVTLFGQADVIKRGVLEVTFATSEGDVTVFVVHLKSRRTERPDDPEGRVQRQAEAEALRDLVLARFPDPAKARFIVCGDFNDTRGSGAVRALLRRGENVLGELLPATDRAGEAWTHYYRREDTYSRIDYLVVSAGLKPLIEEGRGHVFEAPVNDGGSDHRPVFVKLKVVPAGR